MRAKSSVRNSFMSLIANFVSIICNFVAQAIFIRILGAEYLGLNGLFTNILTMLSFFELGIGSAIVFNLYKPIASNDKKKIVMLMNFYKKTYTIISLLVFVCGLIVIPFLNNIVGTVEADVNIYIVYIMFLFSTSSSYILSYKKNIIQAYQRGYLVDIIHIIYIIILNILQLSFLYITKNYYLYLLIKIICQIIENIIGAILANKLFPFIKDKNYQKLDITTRNDIFKKVKALFFHKIGNSIVNGTDNIIISSYLGVVTVGIYSSYNMIITAVNNLFRQMLIAITPSVGNLLTEEKNVNVKYNVFDKIRFINFVISCFSSVCILLIISPFIKLWIGSEYLLGMQVTIVLVINYFQKMQRNAYNVFKDAAGIWYEDRFVPVIESVLNIMISIILLKFIGLEGVFLGTIISGMVLWCYSYPRYVYKKLFERTYWNYIKETLFYILVFAIIMSSSYFISKLFIVSNLWIELIINSIIAILVPIFLIVLIFYKTDNFKYCVNLFMNIVNKINFKRRKMS